LNNAVVDKKDFSDAWIEEYIKENNITALPAIIFDSNQVDTNIDQYLQELPSKKYSLLVGASFDPFAKRSDKGFLLIDKEKLSSLKANSYVKWNTDAKITWLEYSDLECPFCAKLHNSWTPEEITTKYWDKLNVIYNHFPLDFHANALPWAQIMECIWELNWSDVFYTVLKNSYAWRDITKAEDNSKQSSKEFLVDEAVKLWVSKIDLEKCITDNKYTEKIKTGQQMGTELFSITWTPWNVLINNETWEYEVISWAYPTANFEAIIDKLLE
jgi:protein-disulfide isomerase